MKPRFVKGRIYLVTLRGGTAQFGELVAEVEGVGFLGGDWWCFVPGAFDKKAVTRVTEFPERLPGDTEALWMMRNGLSQAVQR